MNTQKFSDISLTSCSFAHASVSTMRNSVSPFGVSGARRIVLSDQPPPAAVGARWRKPPTRPFSHTASVKTVPGTYRSSIDIVKPRSGWLPSHASETASSSARSTSSASSAGTTLSEYPAFVSRVTDWRTLRMARPSSEKSAGRSTASSPIAIGRRPSRR